MMTAQKFQEIYSEYLESGLGVKDFCNNEGMRPSKFFYWQNKLKDLLPPKKGFVPLLLGREYKSSNLPVSPKATPLPANQSLQQPPESPSCEISYPNGVSLKLKGCNDIDLIRSLILLNPLNHV